MDRLTNISGITDLPTICALQESCGESSCADVCEEYGDKECTGCPVQIAISKLAVYEDTGLTPEEIIKLRDGVPVDVTFDIGDDGFLLAINRAFEKLFGKNPDELIAEIEQEREKAMQLLTAEKVQIISPAIPTNLVIEALQESLLRHQQDLYRARESNLELERELHGKNRYAEHLENKADQLEAQCAEIWEALKRADLFITNGVEMGFIRLPDPETNDPALETPGIIRKALAPDAGKAMLEELRRLRELIPAIKEFNRQIMSEMWTHKYLRKLWVEGIQEIFFLLGFDHEINGATDKQGWQPSPKCAAEPNCIEYEYCNGCPVKAGEAK